MERLRYEDGAREEGEYLDYITAVCALLSSVINSIENATRLLSFVMKP